MNNLEYHTTDLNLAATLLYYNFTMVRVNKSQPKAIFIFLKTPELMQTIDDFWVGKLRVEPKAYFDKISEVKARIYN